MKRKEGRKWTETGDPTAESWAESRQVPYFPKDSPDLIQKKTWNLMKNVRHWEAMCAQALWSKIQSKISLNQFI